MRTREFSKIPRQIILIAHNIRSVDNVGSILRTAECLGVHQVIATGYTSNLETQTDGSNLPILPHVRDKLAKQLHRSALGAETMVNFRYHTNINDLINDLKNSNYTIIGLEQTAKSISLPDYHPTKKIALLLGEEVDGLTNELIDQCDICLEIPMFGQKESYNVAVATGIALYQLTIHD